MLAEQKRLAKERAKEQRQLVSGSSTTICLACKQALLGFPRARKFEYLHPQRAKKVVSDSLGLVDFAIGLVNSVFNLSNGQVMFF